MMSDEVLKIIAEPTKHGNIIVLSDIREVRGVEMFTFYLETKGLLKSDKTYQLTIKEL